MPSSMAKYNPNILRQWTCAFTGSETVNANNNFESTGNLENLTVQTFRPNITQPNTTKKSVINFSHL